MRIYVDQAIHRWRGQLWCHMFSPDIDALMDFARGIGMKAEWFQDPRTMPKVSWPHFDVNAARRQVAVRAGAIEVGRHQVSAMSRVVLNRFHGVEGTDRALDPLALHKRLNSPKLPRIEAWLASELAMIERMRTEGAMGRQQENAG